MSDVRRPPLTDVAFHALLEACHQARIDADRARHRSIALCKKVLVAQRDAIEGRLASRPRAAYARVEGTVDGCRSVAFIYRDGSVAGDRALLQRVELVVSLGETFDGGMPATVGKDPLISTLSIARAYDSVRSIDVYSARGQRVPRTQPRPPKGSEESFRCRL